MSDGKILKTNKQNKTKQKNQNIKHCEPNEVIKTAIIWMF